MWKDEQTVPEAEAENRECQEPCLDHCLDPAIIKRNAARRVVVPQMATFAFLGMFPWEFALSFRQLSHELDSRHLARPPRARWLVHPVLASPLAITRPTLESETGRRDREAEVGR